MSDFESELVTVAEQAIEASLRAALLAGVIQRASSFEDVEAGDHLLFETHVERLALLERVLQLVERRPDLGASFQRSLRHEVEKLREQIRAV